MQPTVEDMGDLEQNAKPESSAKEASSSSGSDESDDEENCSACRRNACQASAWVAALLGLPLLLYGAYVLTDMIPWHSVQDGPVWLRCLLALPLAMTAFSIIAAFVAARRDCRKGRSFWVFRFFTLFYMAFQLGTIALAVDMFHRQADHWEWALYGMSFLLSLLVMTCGLGGCTFMLFFCYAPICIIAPFILVIVLDAFLPNGFTFVISVLLHTALMAYQIWDTSGPEATRFGEFWPN